MESHKRVLGILFIISGIFKIFGMILLLGFITIMMPMIMSEIPAEHHWIIEWVIPFLQIFAWGIIFLLAIPAIIGGVGLLNKKKWSLTLVLIVGCFGIFGFPLGTALGIYTIWVYYEEHKASEYYKYGKAYE